MSRGAATGGLAFGREKRLAIGAVALVAPLPLPFNGVLGWGWYLLYAALLVPFLLRARRDAGGWLPLWAVNLLALAYVPVLVFDFAVLSRGGVVGPVLRLGLFAVTVKLWSLRQERDKWHASLGIFFLFLAAAATSVHMSVVLYLVAFLAGALLLLARFALLHLLAGFGHRDASALPVPLVGFTAAAVAAAVVLAVPLFALLPRVSTPYVTGVAGRGTDAEVGVSGFSDEVTLDSIGRVRSSRAVALRLTWVEGQPPLEIRLKGGSFDRFDDGAWRRSGEWRRLHKELDAAIDLRPPGDGPTVGEMEVWLQPLGSLGLPLPVEAARVEVPRRGLTLGRGGSLRLPVRLRRPLDYRVRTAAQPVLWAPPPQPADEEGAVPPTLDTSGVTPAMARLAEQVAGEGSAVEKADALQRWFVEEFTYTLDFVGRGAEAPLEDFLLDHRSGHCEYFASAMVLLLRSRGVHARLATGFLGGERTPLGYFVVREGNAHAWVEAWLPGEGWRIYDPTPPAGRPGLAQQSLTALASQLYDNLLFQWDRYVLTYGVEDQMDVVLALFRGARGLLGRLWGDEEGAPEVADAEASAFPEDGASPSGAEVGGAAGEMERRFLTAALLLLALALAASLWLRYRRPLTATAAYRALRRRLESAGLPLTDATGPLAVERRAVLRFPAAAEGTGRVVRSYLRESFGGEELVEEEREGLRDALDEVKRSVRDRRDAGRRSTGRRTA